MFDIFLFLFFLFYLDFHLSVSLSIFTPSSILFALAVRLRFFCHRAGSDVPAAKFAADQLASSFKFVWNFLSAASVLGTAAAIAEYANLDFCFWS